MGKFSRKIMREHEKGIAFAQRVAEVRRLRERRKKVLSMGLIAAMNKSGTIVEEAEVKGKKVVRVVEGDDKKEEEKDGSQKD